MTREFHCTICQEVSQEICHECTKDTCANHICLKCSQCVDCCVCDQPGPSAN